MGRLRRFRQITPHERRLLFKVWPVLWAVRLSLWLLPFAASRRLVAWASRARPEGSSDSLSPERLARMVKAAARLVPGASCLTQAMAVQIMLARSGYPSRLRFGVRKDPRQGFTAHAWVESGGVTVIGGGNLDRFVELSSPTESPP